MQVRFVLPVLWVSSAAGRRESQAQTGAIYIYTVSAALATNPNYTYILGSLFMKFEHPHSTLGPSHANGV